MYDYLFKGETENPDAYPEASKDCMVPLSLQTSTSPLMAFAQKQSAHEEGRGGLELVADTVAPREK